MLSPEDIFPLYAELSLGLAGFAGVVSAFAGRDRVFRPTERVRFLTVVAASGCVLLGCFAVFGSLAWGASLSAAYQIAGVSCLAISAVFVASTFPPAWRGARDPDSTTEQWSLFVSAGAYLAIFILYGGAIFSSVGFFSLVVGFSIQLLHGLWMFVLLLTRAN